MTLRPTLRAIRLFHELWRICSATLMPFGAAGSGPRPVRSAAPPSQRRARPAALLLHRAGRHALLPAVLRCAALREPKARSTICCDLFCMVLLSIMVWYVLASPCVITAGR